MLCLSDFELYSRWVSLECGHKRSLVMQSNIQSVSMTKAVNWYAIQNNEKAKLPLEFKALKSFRIKGDVDVTCLKTYKNIKAWKTMYCRNQNKLYSLYRFLEFANTRILLKTCPALSWDQALLLGSWVNRFQAGKGNRKVAHLVQYLWTWITCASE